MESGIGALGLMATAGPSRRLHLTYRFGKPPKQAAVFKQQLIDTESIPLDRSSLWSRKPVTREEPQLKSHDMFVKGEGSTVLRIS